MFEMTSKSSDPSSATDTKVTKTLIAVETGVALKGVLDMMRSFGDL